MASEAETLVKQVRRHLEEELDDLREASRSLPNMESVNACVRLAESVATYVSWGLNVRCAAFIEEDLTVGLIIQSLADDRRVTFRISREPSLVSVRCIDEHMKVGEGTFPSVDQRMPGVYAEWVTAKCRVRESNDT